MAAINELCNSAILLDKGSVEMQGDKDKCIIEYQRKNSYISHYEALKNDFEVGNERIKVQSYSATPIHGNVLNINSGVRITVDFTSNIQNATVDLSFYLKNSHEVIVMSNGFMISENGERGTYSISLDIPSNILNEDSYYFDMFWGINRSEIAFRTQSFGFEINGTRNQFGDIKKSPGVISPAIVSEIKKL
jgi:hypothetical protein